jgi:hypothetical protein
MSQPLALSDSELTLVLNAAKPLDVSRRDEFLQEVAERLSSLPHLGDGAVHRVCAEIQRRHWDPPLHEPGPAARAFER